MRTLAFYWWEWDYAWEDDVTERDLLKKVLLMEILREKFQREQSKGTDESE